MDAALAYFGEHGDLVDFDGDGIIRQHRPDLFGGYRWRNDDPPDPDYLYTWTMMGGYQGLTVDITSINKSSITIRVNISDHFGADSKDAWKSTPGLGEMYYLQHFCGYNPVDWSVTFVASRNAHDKH